MNGPSNHNKTFTSQDIEKYLNGELSAAGMHELEKAALDDPFLADAMEGMEKARAAHGPERFRMDKTDLERRLEARVAAKEKTRIVPLYRRIAGSGWKVAAGIVLVAGLAWLSWMIWPARTTRNMSAVTSIRPNQHASESAKIADTASAHVTTLPPAAAISAQAAPPVGADTVHTTPPAMIADAIPAAPVTPAPTRSLAKRKSPVPASAAAGETAAVAESRQADTISSFKEPIAGLSTPKAAVMEDRIVSGTSVSGVVMDQYNRPVPGANVYLKESASFNAVTDKKGNFRLQVPATGRNPELLIESAGFEDASMTISTDKAIGNVIHLRPQNDSLKEVLANTYSFQRKLSAAQNRQKADGQSLKAALPKRTLADTSSRNPVPADGWANYMNWVDSQQPAFFPDPSIHGQEKISFRVDSQGILSSFRVLQSLSPAHDSAAVQLIRQGPAWKLTGGRKTRVTLTLQFP